MDIPEYLEDCNRRLPQAARQCHRVLTGSRDRAAIVGALAPLEESLTKAVESVQVGLESDRFPVSDDRLVARSLAAKSIIAVTDLLDLVTARVKLDIDLDWGAHLVSPRLLKQLGFTRLDCLAMTELIVSSLALSVTSFYFGVVEEIRTALSARPTSIESEMSEICAALGGTWTATTVAPRALKLLDLESTATELGITKRTLLKWANQGKILSVDDWHGQLAFPAFQLDRSRVDSLVATVLRSSDLDPRSWNTALYLRDEVELRRSLADIENDLRHAGRWIGDPVGALPTINSSVTASVDAGSVLYRIVSRENTPFFFSTTDTPGTKGRFDLPSSGADGSIYLANSVTGACKEVFTREPRLSMADLLDRRLWSAEPCEDIPVVDLRSEAAALGSSTDRKFTQQIARDIHAMPGCKGILAKLRSTANEEGVTFFGPKGPTPPSMAGLGACLMTVGHLLESEEVIEFIEVERKLPARYPVITLARLPSDLAHTGAA